MAQTIVFGLMLFTINHLLFKLSVDLKERWGGAQKRKDALRVLFEQDVQNVKESSLLNAHEKNLVVRRLMNLLREAQNDMTLKPLRRYEVKEGFLEAEGDACIIFMVLVAFISFACSDKGVPLVWMILGGTLGMQVLIHLIVILVDRIRPFKEVPFETKYFFLEKEWSRLESFSKEEQVVLTSRTFSNFTPEVVSQLKMMPAFHRWDELDRRFSTLFKPVGGAEVERCENEIRQIVRSYPAS